MRRTVISVASCDFPGNGRFEADCRVRGGLPCVPRPWEVQGRATPRPGAVSSSRTRLVFEVRQSRRSIFESRRDACFPAVFCAYRGALEYVERVTEKQDVQSANRDPLSPLVFLERTLRVFPHKTALTYGDRLQLTYAEFAEEIARLAAALQRAGIRAGDRVAFLAPNVPALLLAHFAVLQLQAVLVAVNTRLQSEEVQYILNHSGAKIVFVDPELALVVAGCREALVRKPLLVNLEDPVAGVYGRLLPGPTFGEFLEGAVPLVLPYNVDDEDRVTSINYTSGTTGLPKGVMYTHRGAMLNALGEIVAHQLTRDSVFLWTVPLFHCNGWCFPWAVTAVGGTHVMLRKADPVEIVHRIQQQGVTHFSAAPTVLLMLAEAPQARELYFKPEVRVATGGAPPSPTLLARMHELGIRVTHLYGLTETYGPHVFCELQPEWESLDTPALARLLARQGVPYHHAVHLRVVDEAMQDVPADGATLGEVVMRGNNVMKGYYEDSEATAEVFRGGWFHSGDLAVMHSDGYLELRDRKKDVIISGGENISSIEVEHVLAKHPAVLECAVVAMPHPRWGEVPKAFVSLKPDTSLSAAELIEFCREHLAHFKCPKAVEFCELPKTATGKIQKFVLREREWAGRDKRIQG